MNISKEQKELLARLLNYVLINEETDYEEVLQEFGPDSDQAKDHIYTLARNAWCEFELDFSEESHARP